MYFCTAVRLKTLQNKTFTLLFTQLFVFRIDPQNIYGKIYLPL